MAKRGKIKNRKGRSRDKIKRPIRFRHYDQLFLVVCEDEKTEPNYLKKYLNVLPENTLYLECVGTGKDPLGVVQEAVLVIKNLSEHAKREVDFVWVVFDKDDADLNESRRERFQDAYTLAKQYSINVGLSNEAFELWLLLHFIDIDPKSPIARQTIYTLLEKEINKAEGNTIFKYKHGDSEVLEKVLAFGNEKQAIDRAITLDAFFKNKDPIQANPSTKIYVLIQELNEWVRYYNWKG